MFNKRNAKTMWTSLFVGLTLVMAVHCEVDCSTVPDGDYNIGCKTFERCANGVHTTIECSVNMVYNNVTKECDFQNNVAAPCGLVKDCTNFKDGSYPDTQKNCTSYFTCNNKVYYGHNFCTPGTVFDQTLGTCVWPEAALPPCGTKPLVTEPGRSM